MQQFKNDSEIPFSPKKRTGIVEKFTTLLMFPPKNGCQVSEWVSDRKLEVHMKQLIGKYPERSAEKEWLSYFLKILLDPSESVAEREMARKHLLSFYQETAYWATRKFKRNFQSQADLWTWEEIFDTAAEMFHDLETAVNDLSNLNLEVSSQKYVKRILYRKITNWRDRKIGRNAMITQIDLDGPKDNLESDVHSLSRRKKIEQAIIQQTSVKEENINKKQQQDRALSAIGAELDKLEASSATAAKIGKTNVSLWVILLLTYGLNLKQLGTAELLKLNQQPINQSTINRHVNPFVLRLQLKLLYEFREEIHEFWGDRLTEESEPIEKTPLFQQWMKKKQKEVENCLRQDLNERMFYKVVTNNMSRLNNCRREELQALIRYQLEAWYRENYEISMQASLLSESLENKVHKIVINWLKLL